jgi:hypothetical protein
MESQMTSQVQVTAAPTHRNRVFVIGNGMTKFYRPGKHDKDYPDLAKQAV